MSKCTTPIGPLPACEPHRLSSEYILNALKENNMKVPTLCVKWLKQNKHTQVTAAVSGKGGMEMVEISFGNWSVKIYPK